MIRPIVLAGTLLFLPSFALAQGTTPQQQPGAHANTPHPAGPPPGVPHPMGPPGGFSAPRPGLPPSATVPGPPPGNTGLHGVPPGVAGPPPGGFPPGKTNPHTLGPPQGVTTQSHMGGRPGGNFSYPGRPYRQVHAPPFAYPRGWGYRRWAVGTVLPPIFLVPYYYYTDWAALGLEPPPPGYQWVRYGPDLLLVDLSTGEVVDVAYGVFY